MTFSRRAHSSAPKKFLIHCLSGEDEGKLTTLFCDSISLRHCIDTPDTCRKAGAFCSFLSATLHLLNLFGFGCVIFSFLANSFRLIYHWFLVLFSSLVGVSLSHSRGSVGAHAAFSHIPFWVGSALSCLICSYRSQHVPWGNLSRVISGIRRVYSLFPFSMIPLCYFLRSCLFPYYLPDWPPLLCSVSFHAYVAFTSPLGQGLSLRGNGCTYIADQLTNLSTYN